MKFFNLEMQDITGAATVYMELDKKGRIVSIKNVDDGKNDVVFTGKGGGRIVGGSTLVFEER